MPRCVIHLRRGEAHTTAGAAARRSAPSAWSVQIGLIYFAIASVTRRRRPHTRMGQAGR